MKYFNFLLSKIELHLSLESRAAAATTQFGPVSFDGDRYPSVQIGKPLDTNRTFFTGRTTRLHLFHISEQAARHDPPIPNYRAALPITADRHSVGAPLDLILRALKKYAAMTISFTTSIYIFYISSSECSDPRAGLSLQTQAPRLQFYSKAGVPPQTHEPRLQFYYG